MSVCDFVLKAENGENSQLFKDIANSPNTSAEQAINNYFYMRSESFVNEYKKKGLELDKNYEPVLENVNKVQFDINKMYEEGVEKALSEADKEKLKLTQTIAVSYPKMQNTIKKRVNFLKNTDAKSSEDQIKELEAMLATMEKEDIVDAMPLFLSSAVNVTTALNNSMGPGKDITYKMAQGRKNAAQAYVMVADVRNTLMKLDNKTDAIEKALEDSKVVMSNIAEIQKRYLDIASDFLTNAIHEYNPEFSKEDIKNELKLAAEDSNVFEQWLGYAGDSKDKILANLVQMKNRSDFQKDNFLMDASIDIADALDKVRKAGGKSAAFYSDAVFQIDNVNYFVDVNAKYEDIKDKRAKEAYKKVQSNPDLLEYMKFHVNLFDKVSGTLGNVFYKEGIGYQMPAVLKSDLELIQDASGPKEVLKIMADSAKQGILRSSLDTDKGELDEFGKPIKKLPVYYSKPYDSKVYRELKEQYLMENAEKGMDPEISENLADSKARKEAAAVVKDLVSLDMAANLQAYVGMATNYLFKKDIIKEMEAAVDVLGSEYREYLQRDKNGNVITKDGRPITTSGEMSTTAKNLEDFVETQLYGITKEDLGGTKVPFTDSEIDNAKGLGLINKSISFVYLSFSWLSAVNNVMVGSVNNWIERLAGSMIPKESWKAGSKFFYKNLGKTMANIGTDVDTSILGQLDKRFNILSSYDKKMKTGERGRLVKLLKLDSLFFMNNMGEYAMQMKPALGVLHSVKTFDKNGKSTGSLLDNFKMEGKKLVMTATHIKNSKGEVVELDNNELTRIREKIMGVIRHLHGNYNGDTTVKAQKNEAANLFYKFKNWAYVLFKRRTQKTAFNHAIGQDVTGYYRDGFNFFSSVLKDVRKLQLETLSENWGKLSPMQKANVHKFILEVGTAIATISAAGLLAAYKDEFKEGIDEEDPFAEAKLTSYYWAMLQTNRLYTELTAFVNPFEAVVMLRNPIPASNILNSIGNVLEQMTSPFEEYESGKNKGENMLKVKAKKVMPVISQFETFNYDTINNKLNKYK